MTNGGNLSGADCPPATSDLRSLYEVHVRDLYRFVHRRCGDRALAEDVTQDVFLRAARAGAPITAGWLYQTARNRLTDLLRRQASYQTKLRLVRNVNEHVSTDARVVERLRVQTALRSLSPLHQCVLVLRYVDGLTVSDLAEAIDRSEKGAEALVTRARAALRAELEHHDDC